MRRAVIDVGSNSVLLLLAEKYGGTWQPVRETSAVSGLGSRVADTGRLGQEGIQRTSQAIKDALSHCQDVPTAIVGTMAMRLAENPQDLSDAVGRQVHVLSGEDEARFSFLSVASDPIVTSDTITVIDPGGQSVEFVMAEREAGEWKIHLRTSRPVGALRLIDGPLGATSSDVRGRLAAVSVADERIGLAALPGRTGQTFVIGASGTNLVTMREGMSEWDAERVHGQELTYEEISRWSDRLCGLTAEQRAELPGLEPGRESTIHAGALLLERCLFAMRAEACRVSVKGWRYAFLESSGFEDHVSL